MAINERLVHTASASAAAGTGNQEEGLMLHLDANDVDSYDGDGDVWYDIHDHEYTPATNVSEHFNTVTYTGNSGSKTVTGVGFTPDLVWIKNRDGAFNHLLRDTVRGNNSVILPNTTTAESTGTGAFEFLSDGFRLPIASSGANNSSYDYVAWCFKAGELLNKSAEFNGSSSNIDISGNPLGVNDFTYSVWFNAGTVSVANQNIITSNAGHVNYGIQVTGTGVSMYALNSSGGAEYLVSNTGLVSAGTWYHIAYVKSSISGHSLYLNGNVVASNSAFTGNCASGTGNETTIGSANNNIQWFNGKISQVRLFNSALTSSQITQLYNETPEENNGHLLGCVAAFPLNDNANEIDNNYTATASNVTFGLPGYANRNNEGTIESTVSVNNKLGFSIVKWSGDGSSATVGHGLDTPPELTIKKNLDYAADWAVNTYDRGGHYMFLNSTNAELSSSQSVNSTTFTASGNVYNRNGTDLIAYCFTSKRGVSKVGSYVGNSNANGPTVTLDFEPAFVMIKEATNTGNWRMMDNTRQTTNPKSDGLFANLSNAESTSSSNLVDFNSDNFQVVGTGSDVNTNNSTYIYYAVAKDTNETELVDTVGFKPSVDPDDHFNTVTYTGDNYNNRDITGVGFQPDLVWIKNRDGSYSHMIYDSVRGATGSGGDHLSSDTTGGAGAAVTGLFNSFNNDGFSINKGSSSRVNQSSEDYVAWCFKAGGAAVSNTDGTVTSQVSANNDLGFSIVKYNGLNTAVTAGHGLESPPEMVICKPLAAGAWAVWHKDMASDLDKNYIPLTTGATTPNASSLWNYSNWGATKIGSSNPLMFGTNNDIIAYCFTSKRGVSKVGSYTGTGASGNKIFTEFEPAFLMQKETNTSGANWHIWDNVRDSNPIENILSPNTSSAEGPVSSGITFNRDGFTINTTNGSINGNGDNYIYLAVAKNTNNEQPYLELNLEADSYSGSGDWLDSSGNGNDGTITGATFEEELGNYFDLDGSGDYIDAPTSGVLSGDFTVEMWWNFDTLSAGYRMLFGSSGYQGGSGLGHYIENGRLRTWVSVSGSTSNVLNGSGTDLTTNKWQHVVLTRSGGTYTQYIDTNQVGQASGTTASLDGTNSRIGGHYNSNGHDINAKVGQVRLYSTALSQAQIRQNFNFTKPKYPNEFHGDINGATWNSSGYFDFDGSNDKVTLPTMFTNTIDQPNKTITMWVNADDVSSGYGMPFSMNQSSLDFGRIIIQLENSSKSLSFLVGTGGSYPATTISANTWYHLAVSVNGSSYECFVNGTSVGTGTNNNSGDSSGDTTIGVYNVSNDYHWNGKISKVRAYNTALTQSEVNTLYGEGY